MWILNWHHDISTKLWVPLEKTILGRNPAVCQEIYAGRAVRAGARLQVPVRVHDSRHQADYLNPDCTQEHCCLIYSIPCDIPVTMHPFLCLIQLASDYSFRLHLTLACLRLSTCLLPWLIRCPPVTDPACTLTLLLPLYLFQHHPSLYDPACLYSPVFQPSGNILYACCSLHSCV